jgi:hypothetical protein
VIVFFYFFDEETDTTVPVPVDSVDFTEQEFIFDGKVRKVWYKQHEEMYFSIVDVCQVLTDTPDPRKYWSVLKTRLKQENSELTTNCSQLKMPSKKDGKFYKTDCATTEQLLRIIQSIPSKKAEPFKLWLAQVGKERLDEYADPELAFERMVRTYRQKGYSEEWIKQRLRSIDIRKDMTDEWHRSGVNTPKDFAILTNMLTAAWSGKNVQDYKAFKGLRKESLRDNMTNLELTLNQLAEVSTTALSKVKNPKGFSESKDIVKEGGNVASNARKELEVRLGESVISPINATTPLSLDNTE